MKKMMMATALLLTLTTGMTAQTKNLATGEKLNRGVVAVRTPDGKVAVSWRKLADDRPGEAFHVYRSGRRITKEPIVKGATFFIDEQPLPTTATYEVLGGRAFGSFVLRGDSQSGYIPIKLDRPQGGTTPDGEAYEYWANDASVGDVDGDGQYEIFLKWEPSNAHDNAHEGYTGPVLIDCYQLPDTELLEDEPAENQSPYGKLLWRIDLGKNIRAGAHYTQMMVYDFDGDGNAELICKTADGTRDAQGKAIGDEAKDWRSTKDKLKGRILDGPEYLTVFDGKTGAALYTTDYVPARGDAGSWGDDYGNRSDRFLAGVAFLDGKRPSAVFCRGYYTRTVLAAWDWDGQKLSQRWVFDTNTPQWAAYAGQGNHNLRVCDVDGDGCDEIIYGAMCVNNDGSGLYNTGFGHGDALHLVPQPKGGPLLVWDCHENKRDGVTLRNAKTGEIVFQNKSTIDVGRCLTADFDPKNPGPELWSIADNHVYNTKGKKVHNSLPGISCNFAIWWDGDLQRELLDKAAVSKYRSDSKRFETIMTFDECAFNNWTKETPSLQADILGDWREEVVTRTSDNEWLLIFVSPHPTDYRIDCLMQNRAYRLSVANQNVGYNQPPEPDFYIGPDDVE